MHGTPPRPEQRVISRQRSTIDGPTVIVTGAVHGNEPAGWLAATRVSADLEASGWLARGQFTAMVGNLAALRAGRRCVTSDLNRNWTARQLSGSDAADPGEHERVERGELLALFDEICDESTGPCVFLDLHTTSAHGPAFACMADVLRNRRYARALELPIVLGLEEVIPGSMLGYICDHGHVGVAVEGGQHDDPAAIDLLEHVIWVTLARAGLLAEQADERVQSARAALRSATRRRDRRRYFEIMHRQVLPRGHSFVMLPGFVNFDPVEHDQLLAHDENGPVLCPATGVVMLPLYQSEGDDGFFLARPVLKAWLWLSAGLRRCRLDSWVPWLPGVSRHPGDSRSLVANQRIARFWVREIFHLFGYRESRHGPQGQIFIRRRPDNLPPQSPMRPRPGLLATGE